MHSQDTALIPLRARDGSVRAYAIVDAADAEWVNQWHWSLRPDGYVNRGTFVGGVQRTHFLHRELTGCTRGDGVFVDHINRNRLDNRRSNLRRGTQSANLQNSSSRKGTSKYRGVSWVERDQRWMACVKVNGKTRNLGYFTDEEEAAKAALAGRKEFYPYALD